MGNATVTPVLSRAEAAAVFLVTFPAVAIILAFVGDSIGLALHPISTSDALARRGGGADQTRSCCATSNRFDSLAFAAIVGFMAAWLLWLAWPHLLPISGGSDLTHHLLLVDYIERSGRLVQDPALRPMPRRHDRLLAGHSRPGRARRRLDADQRIADRVSARRAVGCDQSRIHFFDRAAVGSPEPAGADCAADAVPAVRVLPRIVHHTIPFWRRSQPSFCRGDVVGGHVLGRATESAPRRDHRHSRRGGVFDVAGLARAQSS